MAKSTTKHKHKQPTSERKRLLIENFMKDHNKGLSIEEIAAKYDMGRSTVYRNLQEIADYHKVSRESLLQVIREPSENGYKLESQKVKVNVDDLKIGFAETRTNLDKLIALVDDILIEEDYNEQ